MKVNWYRLVEVNNPDTNLFEDFLFEKLFLL